MRHDLERRYAERVDFADGEAICHCGGFGEHYLVQNLSTAGAQLWGMPLPPVGSMVRLVISMPAVGLVSLAARVTRHEPVVRTLFSVAFEEEDPDKALVLEDMVDRAYAERCTSASYLEHGAP